MRTLRLLVACVAISGLVFAAGCGDDDGTNTETDCTDGIDNDLDGATDCLDTDCAGHPNCSCNFNSLCEPALGETAANCTDCGTDPVCGNGTCEAGENETNCPADCSGGTCGDGTCDAGEDSTSCPQDCPAGQCATDADVLADTGCGTGETCDLGATTAECRTTGTVAAYDACTAPTDCGARTICFQLSANDTQCLPYCDPTDPSDVCPGAGACGATIIGHETLGLCIVPVNTCDPIANDCTAPDVCYLAPTGASCLPLSAAPADPGSPCDPAAAAGEAPCVSGSSCFNVSGNLTCLALCELPGGTCAAGSCVDAISSPDYGVCQ